MQYTERLPVPLPTRSLVTPLVALLIGAAAATGAYALIDNGDELQPSKVIVVERPLPAGEGVAAKDEAASAAAIGASGTELRGSKASASGPGEGVAAKDEAASAAAIGASGTELRGSKASASPLAFTGPR